MARNKTRVISMRIISALTFLTVFGMWGLTIPSQSFACSKKSRVIVMSRNLYIGADIFKIVEAATNPQQGEVSVPMAVAEVFQTIQYTDFNDRVEALADEIKKYKPHLIGLQEVSTILEQNPGDFLDGNPVAATDTVYDYQQILLEALAARNLNYTVAATVTNADVELPMLTGLDQAGNALLSDVRLIDHDIILARNDVGFENPVEQNYETNISLPLAGTTLEFTRGYTTVNAKVNCTDFTFVNTHLEVYGGDGEAFSAVQAAQMDELLAALEEKSQPIILLGDLNSPDNAVIIDSDLYGQIVPPYMQALASGYVDLATQSKKTPEFTCCFNETIDDPLAALYERIDHILLLPSDSTKLPKTKFAAIGDREQDMTASGFWPSDHAGVVGVIDF